MMPIRRPAPLDQLKHKFPTNTQFYQIFDISSKRQASQLDLEAVTRLEEMISRCRQLLWHRESHGQSIDSAYA